MAYRRKSKRTKKPKKTGLTKVEKTQVKTIAKKVTNSLAETKYFATNAVINKIVPNPVWYTGSNICEITCLGYSTGSNLVGGTSVGTNTLKYGVSIVDGSQLDITPLNMNKVFTNADAVVFRRQQQVIGKSLRPSYAECQWYLERPQIDVTNNPLPATPIQVRMIRVKPRMIKGSAQPFNPKQDLFLDQYNEPYGVSSVSTAGNPVFGNYEFQMGKVNSRRYRCLDDVMFTLTPSSVTNDFAGATSYNQVNYVSSGSVRRLKTTHNIGKELYYASPNGTGTNNQYPDTGFAPEYILFHFQSVGQPLSASQRQTTDNINITARPVSTFKDI